MRRTCWWSRVLRGTIIISFQRCFHSVVMCCWISRAGSSTVLVQCQWYPFYVQVMPNSAPFSQADPIERYSKQDTIHQPTYLEFWVCQHALHVHNQKQDPSGGICLEGLCYFKVSCWVVKQYGFTNACVFGMAITGQKAIFHAAGNIVHPSSIISAGKAEFSCLFPL